VIYFSHPFFKWNSCAWVNVHFTKQLCPKLWVSLFNKPNASKYKSVLAPQANLAGGAAATTTTTAEGDKKGVQSLSMATGE
jgi:hypothetical protein